MRISQRKASRSRRKGNILQWLLLGIALLVALWVLLSDGRKSERRTSSWISIPENYYALDYHNSLYPSLWLG